MSYLDNNGLLYFWEKINGKMATKEELNAKAQGSAYTGTIPTTGWSSTAPYYVDVAIEGLSENDTPFVAPAYTGTLATDKAMQESWEKIDRITTLANKLRVYAFEEKPTVAIPIKIQVVSSVNGSSSGGSGYSETELLSAPVEYALKNGATVFNQSIILNDDIANYDELVFDFSPTGSSTGNDFEFQERFTVSGIVYNAADIYTNAMNTGSLIHMNAVWNGGGSATCATITFFFQNGTTIIIGYTAINHTTYDKFRIKSIKGIKY